MVKNHWLVVWNHGMDYDFPETVENNHHPNWRSPSFFRGVGLNHQPEGMVHLEMAENMWQFSRRHSKRENAIIKIRRQRKPVPGVLRRGNWGVSRGGCIRHLVKLQTLRDFTTILWIIIVSRMKQGLPRGTGNWEIIETYLSNTLQKFMTLFFHNCWCTWIQW